jgi:hypothetical protein
VPVVHTCYIRCIRVTSDAWLFCPGCPGSSVPHEVMVNFYCQILFGSVILSSLAVALGIWTFLQSMLQLFVLYSRKKVEGLN